ncbi:MAG: 16S rRNA (guanine(966)-N(2))-methyltransferase RsmD [Eubacteriaceae bacterium]
MRVIAGSKRGKKLAEFKGESIRPTSDKVKGAIFSSLQNEIKTCQVFVDLFGGTGAMGIEALSRGSKKAYFFDSAKESIQLINKNLKLTDFENQGSVNLMSAKRGIDFLGTNNIQCDIIFMDPPYKMAEECVELIELISKKEILRDFGKIVIECEKSVIMPLEKNNFRCIKSKKYGNTMICYYDREINRIESSSLSREF